MKRKSMILLIVMLTIGFAAVSTTLIINGVVGVGTKPNNFVDGVVFDEDSLTSSEGTTVNISESGRTITFTTQEMTSVGEEAKVNFKIKNYSQYNAVLSTPAISCYFVDSHEVDTKATQTSTTNEYMEIIPGHELDGKIINAGGGLSNESSVTVKQIKSYTGDKKTIKFQCEINASASDSETPSITKPPVYNVTFDTNGGNAIGNTINVKYGKAYGELPIPTHNNSNYTFTGWYTESGEKVEKESIVSKQENHVLRARWMTNTGYEIMNDGNKDGIIDIGDEISVGTESFYVISHTATEINALAKYNLNVGDYKDSTLTEGIQQSSGQYAVVFSNNNGWEKGATIDIKQYDGPVKEALYGANGYEKYIQNTIPTASVRLITKGEIETLVNDGNSFDNNELKSKADVKGYSWLYSTTYWTQSALSSLDFIVWYVYLQGYLGANNFSLSMGVRPVITIPLG